MADLEATYDIAWCEEPARRFDYRGLRRVSEQIRAAVATGENLAHVGHYMPLLLNEAVDLVQIGHGTGGITGAMQVAEVAHAFELPVAMMSCPGEVVAHAAAAMPHHTMMEVIDAGLDAVVHTSHQISDGSIVLSSDVPGTGLSVNEDAMARLGTEQISPEAAQFPWGRAANAGRTLDR
jgi:L-alanine-DL-glutamate epimerase-like enolase superfamily enzyme